MFLFKPPFSSRIFQPAMFDYQGVSSGKHEENVGTAWKESEEQPEVDQRKTVFFFAGLSGKNTREFSGSKYTNAS